MCVRGQTLLAHMSLDACLVHQFKQRKWIVLDRFASFTIGLFSVEQFVYLSDIAVGVWSQGYTKVTHFAVNLELGQLDSLALVSFLAHGDKQVNVEVTYDLRWLSHWLTNQSSFLVIEIAIGDL